MNKEYHKTFYRKHKEKRKAESRAYKSTDIYKAKRIERDSKIRRRYTNLKSDAKRRNLEFNLDYTYYESLIKPDQCYYCEGPLAKLSGALDRIDNNKGYILENVVPCCRDCNVVRNRLLSIEEMLEIVKLLRKLREKQQIWQ